MSKLALSFLILGVLASSCGAGSGERPASSGTLLLTHDNVLLRRDTHGTKTLVAFAAGSFVRAPAPSPDGKQVAFVLQPPAGRDAEGRLDIGSDLYVASIDGTGARRLLAHASSGEFFDSPAWLPDGTTLVFAVRSVRADALPDNRVETLELATVRRRRVIDGAAELALTPDGRDVVFVRTGRADNLDTLEVAPMAGGAPRMLVSAETMLTLLASPAVSPDGKSVAFVAAGGGDPPVSGRGNAGTLHPTLQDVWLVGVDGSNLRKLSDIAQTRASVAWSQDGRSLYVLGEEATWQINVSTGERRKIGDGIPWGQIVVLKN